MKPMLASAVEKMDALKFPLQASPKLDGVRALVRDGVVMSRNFKPIPNRFVQKTFGTLAYQGLDSELIVGDPRDKNVYRNTISGVMSEDGEPDVRMLAFDFVSQDMVYSERRQHVHRIVANSNNARLQMVQDTKINNIAQLEDYEENALTEGYEGVMLRSENGKYKFGRSTVKEGHLLKLKRFLDAEAEIIGYEELMHNGNEATKDELGRTKRSSHQAGKTGLNMLGAFVVKDKNGIVFNVGSGLLMTERADLWETRQTLIGKFIKYKYFPMGSKERPRFPGYLGFRPEGT